MDPETTDAVTEWEPVTAGSGYAGLRSLADDEFCGAVTAGATWAFFLNGRIVGVFDGGIEDFSDADLTAYRAPDPALSLLLAMRETGGETRGQYYTKKTPLAEVDRTLSQGNFTGYVELSENVLSGDYYVVYHGGRSMSVAFVGASERLVTGDEAFDLAADEVGIYDVNAVDVSIVEIPGDGSPAGAAAQSDREEGGPETAGAAATGDVTFGDTDGTDGKGSDDGADEGTGDKQDRLAASASTGAVDPDHDRESNSGTDGEPGTVTSTDDDSGETSGRADEEEVAVDADESDPAAIDVVGSIRTSDGDDREDGADSAGEADSSGDGDDADVDTADSGALDETADGIGAEVTNGSDADGRDDDTETLADDPAAVHEPSTDGPTTGSAGADGPSGARDGPVPGSGHGDPSGDEDGESDGSDENAAEAGDEGAFTAERQWRETRRVPALDPDESMDSAAMKGERDGRTTDGETADPEAMGGESATDAETPSEPDTAETDAAQEPETDAGTDPDVKPAETPDTIAEDLDTLKEELASAEADRDALAERVEELQSRLETVTRERDEYRERVADLESELDRLREAADRGEDADGGERLSPAVAREGTNLFVRYRSKGKPTLDDAQAGGAKQGEVVENLRVEYHTTFDDEAITVDGEPYEAFLHATTEWGFVRWVVEELLYEIGRSGHRTDLSGLFDAIPEIDRVQFDGEVPVTVAGDSGESHESRTFDLVFWDSMGDPLFVADVETGRNATTAGMVDSLVEGARAVGESRDTLGGAFFVTSSFFDPGALDAVGDATSSGLLSRNSKTSFVKLSRKRGYHLCLVEARGDEFHLSVPEL
jgi:hypothetical protein